MLMGFCPWCTTQRRHYLFWWLPHQSDLLSGSWWWFSKHAFDNGMAFKDFLSCDHWFSDVSWIVSRHESSLSRLPLFRCSSASCSYQEDASKNNINHDDHKRGLMVTSISMERSIKNLYYVCTEWRNSSKDTIQLLGIIYNDSKSFSIIVCRVSILWKVGRRGGQLNYVNESEVTWYLKLIASRRRWLNWDGLFMDGHDRGSNQTSVTVLYVYVQTRIVISSVQLVQSIAYRFVFPTSNTQVSWCYEVAISCCRQNTGSREVRRRSYRSRGEHCEDTIARSMIWAINY